jgi:hypothetical protein
MCAVEQLAGGQKRKSQSQSPLESVLAKGAKPKSASLNFEAD